MIRRRLSVSGEVQGVGFRPFLARLAREYQLGGWVRNDARGVCCEVEGPAHVVTAFLEAAADRPPQRARIETVRIAAASPRGGTDFVVWESAIEASAGRVPVAPDVATCRACRADIAALHDRRYRYAFASCTDCGPRWTVLEGVPYERARTTLRDFPLCADCAREYGDVEDRRFHAETTACPACGPQVWLRDATGHTVAAGDPLVEARRRLAAGQVVAVKGLGGYHLCCDATSDAAVARLRGAKRRGDKPFAVMVATLTAAERLCEINAEEAALLASPAAPIVLCTRRHDAPVAAEVAPRQSRLGLLLAYTPLHALLLAPPGELGMAPDLPSLDAVVCTSANLSDEPLIADDDAMQLVCARFADAQLGHTRRISGRCDDSVVQVVGEAPMWIRRARGVVPAALPLPASVPEPLLVTGGVLKAAAGIAVEDRLYLTTHLGDLDSVEGQRQYAEAVDRLCDLVDLRPELVLYDRHPDGFSARFAETWPAHTRIGVQHHEAHVYAAMGEAGLREEPVIGLALDGYGWGSDGTSWGGEAFLVTAESCARVARLRPVPQPGGDIAVREPWRMAMAHAAAAGVLDSVERYLAAHVDASRLQRVRAVAAAEGLSVYTSSMGRLFDTVACLAGLGTHASYEAELAQALEAAAGGTVGTPYSVDWQDGELAEWDTGPMVRAVVADRAAGASAAEVAARFHATVVSGLVELCLRLRSRSDVSTVCVGGGVWQNRLLVEQFTRAVRAHGFRCHVPSAVPPNDGGLAYGQAVAALRRVAVCV